MEHIIVTDNTLSHYDKRIKEHISKKYGADMSIGWEESEGGINPYKLKFALKSGEGCELFSKTVDFPLEQLVVSGRYEDEMKSIILSLKDGSELKVPVGELVKGLASSKDTASALFLSKEETKNNCRLTVSLSNINGTVISNESVDIPIKESIVNGIYNEASDTLDLTFTDGSKTSLPVNKLIDEILLGAELSKKALKGEKITDTSAAFSKNVPEKSALYARLSKVGGITRKCTNMLDSSFIVNTSTASAWARKESVLKPNTTYVASCNIPLSLKPIIGIFFYNSQGVASGAENQVTEDKDVLINTLDDGIVKIQYIIHDLTYDISSYNYMLNEGSTALPYEPYFEGLRDAKVTKIKSSGANLANLKYETSTAPIEIAQTPTKLSLTVNTTANGYFRLKSIPVEVGKTYTISGNVTGGTGLGLYIHNETTNANGTVYGNLKGDNSKVTFTATTPILVLHGYIKWATATAEKKSITLENIMLNKGDTVLPFTPYGFEHTLEIPKAILGGEVVNITEPTEIAKFAWQEGNDYDSWAKSMYDEENSRILTVYASGPDHAYINKDIYVAEYSLTNKTITYHKVIEGGTASVKPMGIIKHNGEYIILYTYANTDIDADGYVTVDDVTKIYRAVSTDLVNWTGTDITDAFGFSEAANGIKGIDNMYLLDGSLYVSFAYPDCDGGTWAVSSFRRSDDYGISWTKGPAFNYINGEPITTHTCPGEMVFHKIGSRIIMLARKGFTSDRDNPIPLLFGYSDDGGATWSENLTDTVGITDATNSNLSIAQYDENNVIVMFATRRRGTAGIYYSITPNEMAYNGEFNAPTKLNDGVPTADFGYPYVFNTSDGWYYTFYTSNNPVDVDYASVYMYKMPTGVTVLEGLEGYGQSNPHDPNEYNYIDLKEKKAIIRGYINEADQWTAYDTPKEIDLSGILGNFDLIPVEGGGTLTFENEHGYDVPSEVEFHVNNNGEVSASTFIGDLYGVSHTAKYDTTGRDIAATIDALLERITELEKRI